MFCVSLAAEWDEKIQVGVIYHPVLKETYIATLGGGAYLLQKNKKTKLQVSKTTQLKNSLLTTGFTYKKNEYLHFEIKAFENISQIARAVRRPGSAALDLAYTARGVFDGFWERNLSPWDIAAGLLLVQEAGGQVSDLKNRPIQIEQDTILATNGKIHLELQKLVNKV
jgi:myo-inositol-1(or 4)-monophosphatase